MTSGLHFEGHWLAASEPGDKVRASSSIYTMKVLTFISCLVVAFTVGCAQMQHAASSSRHLAEAQALAIARPMLPLPAGESYCVRFSNGTWEVWAESSQPREGWTVVVIRDIDGQAHVEERL